MSNLKKTELVVKCYKCYDKPKEVKRSCQECNGSGHMPVFEKIPNKILNLTLNKQWFNMIATGEKREEYREIKKHWTDRIDGSHTHVLFTNGYGKDKPIILCKITGLRKGIGKKEWGAPEDKEVFIISLGDRSEVI